MYDDAEWGGCEYASEERTRAKIENTFLTYNIEFLKRYHHFFGFIFVIPLRRWIIIIPLEFHYPACCIPFDFFLFLNE